MNLNKLYDLVDNEKIKVYECNIDNANGIFVNINGINAIALNKKEIDTSTKEKCVVAEELGHYYYDATYSPLCLDVSFINKQEFRAKKWAFKTLIPASQIIYLLNHGITDICEMAEEIGVTEELLKMACEYYKENNYIRI